MKHWIKVTGKILLVLGIAGVLNSRGNSEAERASSLISIFFLGISLIIEAISYIENKKKSQISKSKSI